MCGSGAEGRGSSAGGRGSSAGGAAEGNQGARKTSGGKPQTDGDDAGGKPENRENKGRQSGVSPEQTEDDEAPREEQDQQGRCTKTPRKIVRFEHQPPFTKEEEWACRLKLSKIAEKRRNKIGAPTPPYLSWRDTEPPEDDSDVSEACAMQTEQSPSSHGLGGRLQPWPQGPRRNCQLGVEHAILQTSENTIIRTFDDLPTCRCGTRWTCLRHACKRDRQKAISLQSMDNKVQGTSHSVSFPTSRRVERRQIDITKTYEELQDWATNEGIQLGSAIPDEHAKFAMLQVLWTHRDVSAKEPQDIPETDLLVHRVTPRQGLQPHKAVVKRLSNNKEWWLRAIIQEGINSGTYEKTILANGRVSAWNSNAVVVPKENSERPRLTFNYHFVYEEPPAAHMELAERVHSLLGIPTHTTFFSADMKHGYWAVGVHPV